MSTLLASDLDRTLIYSSAALRLAGPDADAPRLMCVEVYEGRPLSYLTETAAGLLAELAGTGALVPATTRTVAQYRRVRLPGPPPRYAVCANGGEILVDGEPDTAWRTRVRRAVADGCASLDEIRAYIARTADPVWLLKDRTADDLFAYLVVDRERLPAAWVDELAAWAGARGWNVSLQGRKVYAVPRPVTKGAAVTEVARRAGATRVLAAGDSLLDADLLLAADRGWRPGHGELADSGWSAPHVTALETVGVAAGEEIVRAFAAVMAEDRAAVGVRNV
ncbi:HAD family hydrolase [Streptomyces sp. AV19]|uniref:HAD family hydrolase n=1 Tax=Streptomyces sp. AV19 TaxID=2793068 RepID=UPI0018FE32FD|nr:HAD family hydrolase [Streptomyces sp. AV19]MBH1933373.1 HAD family hydrolase [Streptomyces sp. AV19]MDG4531984.1 HAD family hydrolase [Streptomyces sp. AV19]